MNRSEKERLHRYRTKDLRLMVTFFAVMSVGMVSAFASLATDALKTARLLRHGQTVNAVVVDNIQQTANKQTVYLPRFHFRTLNEHDVTFTAEDGDDPPRYAVGTTVLVRYDPDDPSKAIIVGSRKWDSGVPLFIAGIGAASMIVVLTYVLHYMWTVAWLCRHGLSVQAQYLCVEPTTGAKEDKYFRFHCQWRDPLHGDVYEFKSYSYPAPVPSFDPQAPVTVFLDPRNYKRYFVDMDSIPTTNPVSPALESSAADEPVEVQHTR